MSRHRNYKISYNDDDDEWDVDEDEAYDDVPASPGASQYIYRRPRLSSSNNYTHGHRLAEFIQEEKPDDCTVLENDVVDDEPFEMDDVSGHTGIAQQAPSTKISLGPPPGFNQPVYDRPIVVSLPPTSTPEPPQYMEQETPVHPNVSNLRSDQPVGRSHSKSPSRNKKGQGLCTPQTAGGNLPSTSSTTRLSQLAAISAVPATPRRTRRKETEGKELVNLVIVGHVDAGKSTLMGHLLFLLGCVDQRTMHKYRQESARNGKASFAFAWVLDETEEERARGVTMDIAKTSFETSTKRILILDAPGHKDFIPNMITGASQADASVLVVNATRGEFETGFENGGQTKEHVLLLRSLGVSQLVVAVNKLDTVDWEEGRFKEVQAIMTTFLAKAGYSKIKFVPVSGLSGANLVSPMKNEVPAASWYQGPTLIDLIDSFSAPKRSSDGPLRIVVNDVVKATTTSLSVSGKIESGEVEVGDKVFIMPNADSALVKACSNDDGGNPDQCVAGDQALLTLQGTFEPDSIHAGAVVVRGGQDALIPGRRYSVRLVVFDIVIPLMRGTKAELYCHSVCEPCTIVKLVSSINKANGEVTNKRPRCLAKNMSGLVEIETEHDLAIEPYTKCRALGRITLRAGGQTLAAGIVESKIL